MVDSYQILLGDNPYIFCRQTGLKKMIDSIYSGDFLIKLIKKNKFKVVSEYKIVDSDFYLEINKNHLIEKSLFNKKQLIEIINSCRGLRRLEFEESVNLIKAGEFTITKFLQKKPSFILLPSIDNYLLDIFQRYLIHKNINFLPVTLTPLSPKFTFCSSRGEYFLNNSKVPSYKKVKKILTSNLKNNIAPNIVRGYINSLYITFKSPLYIYRYFLFKFFKRYTYEHYFSLFFFNDSFPNLKLIIQKKVNLKEIINISKNNKIAYFPINVYPEITIDYWTKLLNYSDYAGSLVKIINLLKNENYKIIIKTHPFFPIHISKKLIDSVDNRNVFIAQSQIKGISIIEISDLIIQPSGTSIFQALLLSKPVIACANSPYTRNLKSKSYRNLNLPESFLFFSNRDNDDEKVYLEPWIKSHI